MTTMTSLAPPEAHDVSPSLEALTRLFQAMHLQGIRYCHWKSNLRLEKSLQGGTDLDLLVDRRQHIHFRQLLLAHGIKPLIAPPSQRFPAMEHYLGFDEASGKLFHLHVHYQLVLGEEFIKNFRLPLEEAFLSNTRWLHGVRIPAAELELIVLALRILLKYRDRDALKDILGIRSSKIVSDFLPEVEWLLTQTTPLHLEETLLRFKDILPTEIIRQFLHLLQTNPRQGWALLRLRQRLRHSLHLYRRNSPWHASLDYFLRLWARQKIALGLSPTTRLTLPEGGITLALIGADGAGKSTLTDLLARWLSWKVDTHVYYLGSKRPSRRSRVLYLFFRALRRSHRTFAAWFGEQSFPARHLADLRDTLLSLHALSIGHDRYQRYMSGQKQAAAGSFVIYDRFPLSAIDPHLDTHLLDGPQVAWLTAGKNTLWLKRICQAEENLYRQMHAPEHVVILEVSPAVSRQRKPDHKPEAIAAKIQALRSLTSQPDPVSSGLHLIPISADQPLEQVFAQLKREVWQLL